MKIGFLGCGKMASALIGGVLDKGVFSPCDIYVTDCYGLAREAVVSKWGVNGVEDNAALAREADVLLLCVKPVDALGALRTAGQSLEGKTVISIVAGLSLETLQSVAGGHVKIIRVMPNTPALIGKGAAAYSVGVGASEEDAALVAKIFSAVGTAVEVKESLMDAVTAVSGSGPAYVYLMIEALADGGVLMGLPRDLAMQLATQTVLGSAAMVQETKLHPAVLKDHVTSPGGTTIAGLEVLEQEGVRAALMGAIRAAAERSRELGGQ